MRQPRPRRPVSDREGSAERRPIEIDWAVLGGPDGDLVRVTRTARGRLRRDLEATLPGFDWRIRVTVVDARPAAPVEPAEVISDRVGRDADPGADLLLVVTDQPLARYERSDARAALSRATAAAVLSTDGLASDEGDGDRRADRLAMLALKVIGRLLGHGGATPPDRGASATDLDRPTDLTPEEAERLRPALERIADPRVEEMAGPAEAGLRFYARAVWRNRIEIAQAVLRTRPWLFPLRLSRLTTAALSALLILVMTAEAWDLALRQPGWLVAAASVAALIGTSAFILARQQLLLHRGGGRLTELRVVSNVSIAAIVSAGMAVTYGALFVATLAFAMAFFDAALVASWAPVDRTVTWRDYVLMSGFVATVGILIGALGASFEARGYFRHVAYVDEEV